MRSHQGDLPAEWEVVPLGSVCAINPRRMSLKMLPEDTPVTFVPMAAVDAELGAITQAVVRPLREVKKGYTAFIEGDVLFAKITPCMENGKAAIAGDLSGGLGFGSSEFHVLRPSPAVSGEYVWWFVRQTAFRRLAEENMTGSVGQLRVPPDFMARTLIPLPPRAEQDVIVRAIGATADHSRNAVLHLDGARHTLTRFRQAVLAAACSGRLTADYRQASGESCELLLAEVDRLRGRSSRSFSPLWEPEVPRNWAVASLDRLTSWITSGSRGWASYYANTGPVFIRAQNIKGDRLELEDVAHVQPPVGSEGERTKMQVGDLLVTITGANVTKAALVDRDIGAAYVNQHVALARPVMPQLGRYLHLWMLSELHGRRKLLHEAYGAGRPGLNLDNLRETPVGLPPLGEQIEIANRVDRLLEMSTRVERATEAAESDITKSSQAALAKAFRGELVPSVL